jgi:hypothetical protein
MNQRMSGDEKTCGEEMKIERVASVVLHHEAQKLENGVWGTAQQ